MLSSKAARFQSGGLGKAACDKTVRTLNSGLGTFSSQWGQKQGFWHKKYYPTADGWRFF